MHEFLTTILAYRPFIDPLNLQKTWFFLLAPLCLGVSVAYKAVRVADLSHFWRQVAKMTLQLILLIILVGAALFAVVQYVLPLVVPMH